MHIVFYRPTEVVISERASPARHDGKKRHNRAATAVKFGTV